MGNLISPAKKRMGPWVILAALALVWGSSFILIKKGLVFFSSQEVGALRIAITFLVLAPFAFRRIRHLTKRDWGYLVMVGIIGSGFPAFLFAKAQTGIDSSLAGILNSLTPLFTLLIGLGFFSLKTRWFNIAGIFLGLAGAAGLISVSGGQSFEFNVQYAAYILIATICYATNVNIIKYRLKEIDAVTITAMSFFTIGAPVLLYLIICTDFLKQISSDPGALEGLGYIAILAVLGTGLALIAFNKLVKLVSPLFAASVTYLIPIVAVFWGIIDGEEFSGVFFLWMALILAGVFLANKKHN